LSEDDFTGQSVDAGVGDTQTSLATSFTMPYAFAEFLHFVEQQVSLHPQLICPYLLLVLCLGLLKFCSW
jgi:hypothetical protein